MKKKDLQKSPFTAIVTVVFFIFSIAYLPSPLLAETLPATEAPKQIIENPLAVKINPDLIPNNNFKLIKSTPTSYTKVEFDLYDMSRIYSITEIRDGKELTLKYLYDDVFESVTVLLSVVKKGEQPDFTYYYRYAVGPSNSLELVLEEGWATKDSLIPSVFYEYYPDGIQVRFFDKSGNLLRIDNSDGHQKHFIYTREGKLLTIKQTDPFGNITFYDQLLAGLKEFNEPYPVSKNDSKLFTLPIRDSEKRLQPAAFRNPDLDFGLNHSKGHLTPFKADGRFLEWLVSAHPMRAGPMKGGKF